MIRAVNKTKNAVVIIILIIRVEILDSDLSGCFSII